MKRKGSPVRIGLLSILPLLVLLTGCAEDPPGYFEHEEDEFSLVLPQGWNLEQDPPGASVVAWKGERNDRSPTVTVVTYDLPEEATNENFAELNFREIAALQGFTRGDERIALDGDTVTARIYAYRIDGKWRQGLLAAVVSAGRHGYVLNCSSLPERFQGDKEEYMKILNSFKRE